MSSGNKENKENKERLRGNMQIAPQEPRLQWKVWIWGLEKGEGHRENWQMTVNEPMPVRDRASETEDPEV